ncbi:phosphoglucosamine mutase [Leptospirillum ferriphilum]|uniref:Phosphoglucosamine mutase n=1 Tax=Leptospirillum ferriphilum (strain ML-04) TaxID=1048260 RepID=J9ZD01_LEPFM|nr:phosphoglucosamine mutase [Leptospirillum ferriphilum]AFS54239.1 phosphomannomutase [Leptospirillum ferriphilum ML-04]
MGRERTLFGTDGIRGMANVEPVTGETAFRLGRAAAFLFKKYQGEHRVVIGKDTRISGYMLEHALTSGICSMGVSVILVGPFTTPGIAFLTRALRTDAGIMISASHNPFPDNGIKFFSSEGSKLPDDVELRIEELVLEREIDGIRPTGDQIGKVERLSGAEGRYIEFIKNTIPRKQKFDGVHIVMDLANGGGYRVAPMAFRELGAHVTAIGNQPDGTNINDQCGALHPEKLAETVRASGANLGVGLDGDADRAIFVTASGKVLDGDAVMALVAAHLKEKNLLKQNTLVTTVMSNMGLDLAMERKGIRLRKTQVGDRYVLEELENHNLSFGGEQSGHLIFRDFHTTGDGLMTAIQVVSLLVEKGLSLEEAASIYEAFPQVLKTVPVRKKVPLGDLARLSEAARKVEAELAGKHGRLLLRYSGTELALRIMLEGPDSDQIEAMSVDLLEAVRRDLGEPLA